MLSSLLDFIRTKALFDPKRSQLLAVSGGVDSVVLTELFSQAEIPFAIAHVNYGLRGEASDGDRDFVAQLAQEKGVQFFETRFKTADEADRQKRSIQEVGRDFRFGWLESIRVENGFETIALGTHLSDQTETILFNLSRGTGIRGWQGILPKRDQFVRPLLFASRDEIEAFAREHQLEWREDESNHRDEYDRNFIRHNVVPPLKTLNPSLDQSLAQHAEYVAGVREVYRQWLDNQRPQLLQEENGRHLLDIKKFQALGIPGALFDLLQPFGFSSAQMPLLKRLLESESGKTIAGKTHLALRDREQLILSPLGLHTEKNNHAITEDQQEVIDPIRLKISRYFPEGRDRIRSRSKEVALLDREQLTFPLHLRPWQPGDWFQPLGMKGRKKISDFLIDNKVPLTDKENIWLLLSGDDIVWVVGHRLDDRFKVTAQTAEVLSLERVQQ